MLYPHLYQELLGKNDLERRLEEYYRLHGQACTADKLETLSQTQNMIPWGFRKNEKIPRPLYQDSAYSMELSEEDYFSEESDIVILKNLRYTAVGEHQHAFFEIMYMLSGSCTNVVDSTSLLLEKGDFCIIPPQVVHSINVESDSVLLNILVRTSTFTDAFMPLLRSSNILSDFFNEILYSNTYKKYLLFHTREDERILDYILQIYQEQSDRGRHYGEIMNGLMMAMFGKLLQIHDQDVEYPESYVEKYDKIPKILAYVKKNCRTVSLASCAEHFHFNSQYLSSLLKKHTGRTFSALLTEERMLLAGELLQKTDKPVKQIALETGYADEAYFMKVFKKYFGCTPTNFRTQTDISFLQ